MKIIVRVMRAFLVYSAVVIGLCAQMVPVPLRKNYPCDISFMIVDLKYDVGRLKVCEFGMGCLSGFVGHERLYGAGKIWEGWWSFVHTFGKPLIFVARSGPTRSFQELSVPHKDKKKDKMALQKMFTLPGIRVATLQDGLKALSLTKHYGEGFQAIAMKTEPRELFEQYAALGEGETGVIAVDYATSSFALNKLYMHTLFVNDPAVARYRPQCRLLYKNNVVQDLETINAIMPADAYVIKPINAWKGEDIQMSLACDLVETSKNILWKNRTCMFIESLEHSMPIIVDAKPYDATMRVALGLAYDQGNVTMKVLGAYWKLPVEPLTEQVSLLGSFLSRICKGGRTSSAIVDSKTLAGVSYQLAQFMPHVYKKMVALKHSHIPLQELVSVIDGTADAALIKRLETL